MVSTRAVIDGEVAALRQARCMPSASAATQTRAGGLGDDEVRSPPTDTSPRSAPAPPWAVRRRAPSRTEARVPDETGVPPPPWWRSRRPAPAMTTSRFELHRRRASVLYQRSSLDAGAGRRRSACGGPTVAGDIVLHAMERGLSTKTAIASSSWTTGAASRQSIDLVLHRSGNESSAADEQCGVEP